MRSIGRQLGISLFISLLLPGLLIGQIAIWWLDQRQRVTLAVSLHDETISILAALNHSTNGIRLSKRALDPVYRRPLSGRYFLIILPNAHLRSRSLWDFQLQAPTQEGLNSHLIDGPQGQKLLRYRAHYQIADQPVIIIVALNYAPQLNNFTHAKTGGLLIWILVLAILAAIQQWLIRRGLRPLHQVRQQLKQLRDGQRTMLDTNVARELKPLVDEVNRLQDYTERQLRRSRHAVGDLGHGLKTPLAVIKNQCRMQLFSISPELAHNINDQLLQMENSIKRALGRARIAAIGATATSCFAPAEDIPLLLRTLQQAHNRDLNLKVEGDLPSIAPFDREDMLEILGNLLDNACKWAHKTVVLSLQRQTTALIIIVTDDGPGIAPDHRQAMLVRGQRLDQRVPGQGLGLDIVSDMVEVYEGELLLDDKPEGGLRVQISLPLPSKVT
ncbi:ATP-binding region ATPase domain-containing protein [Candidatus Nitrosoglobus terrae]|uniref:histidine kinase n=1 Tax=Candidatus Nitrosoglobus terrae TaxID=1630141 RepID=A0A1Q2SKK7_9GAMM|nr:ATP-binding protein [Candidatus Nitrosoglobus terrae]BAW79647.1 ATP-binding region ATPase domain-containing protein [Candidatus Nitrosoglobus terrae]